ncbi:hypothetical protein CerSpe_152920 [Prunus speciosa]
MQYGDKSFSVGFLGKESLTLTSTEVFDEFLFGCGQTNQGNFGSSAGFLGLGRHNISFVQQTANKYGRIFSYCLPSTSSSTGYLGFGKDRRGSKHVKFMPLTTVSQNPSFYGLNLVGISVGGRKLWISPSVFLSSGTIIDTGTVITRLPVAAYSALRDVFRQAMTKYPLTQALSVLDTCYDLSSYVTVKYPHIAFYFQGGLKLKLDATGIFYSSSASQVCLAFAGNDANNKFAVLGNVQQKTFEVVYDVAGGRVGFASGASSGLQESAATSPASHHDSCWSKGGGGDGSQSSDQELALLRAVDAMALSTLSMEKDLESSQSKKESIVKIGK